MQHGVPRVSAVDKTEVSRERELKKIEAYQDLVKQIQDRVRRSRVYRIWSIY